MKEGTVAETARARENGDFTTGGFTSSAVFPALVGLWFAALFGAGCLFLPQVLFDAVFGETAPLGENTRIVAALVAAALGLVLGLFIASRVRTDGQEHTVPKEAEAPAEESSPKPLGRRGRRARAARAPLDIRSALGLPNPEDDEDEDDFDREVDAEFSDEVADTRPPIDDPYFASAWSDSEPLDLQGLEEAEGHGEDQAMANPFAQADRSPALPTSQDEWAEEWDDDRAPDMAPQEEPVAPSRYNPFADFVDTDDAPRSEDAFAEPEEDEADQDAPFEQVAPADAFDRLSQAMRRTDGAPPPPAWPQPRADEPTLTELGVAELVERLARALQGEEAFGEKGGRDFANKPSFAVPPRIGGHRHDSALAPSAPEPTNIDQALREAIGRLSRLDDVA